MKAGAAGVVPSWKDFSAFDDMSDIEHVCYQFETAADEKWDDVSGLAGDNSPLIKRLVMQDTASRDLLESERPGLYPKTWMAYLMQQLYLTLDQVTEKPYLLPGELSGFLLNFHKVLIAAHEIYDPAHRAKLVADAATNTISARARNAVNARHAAPGGSHDLRAEAWRLFNSGTYGNKKDDAAAPISKKLGVAYSTARKYLRGNPPNQAAS